MTRADTGTVDGLTAQIFGGVAIVVALAVTIVALWALRQVLFAWPRRTAGTQQPIGLVPLLLALIVVPSVWMWALATASQLFQATAQGVLTLFQGATRCTAGYCDTVQAAGQTALAGTIDAVQVAIDTAPVGNLLLFLVLCFALSWIAQGAFKRESGPGPARLTLLARAPGVVTGLFIAIIIFAFYLCLSALLALPLMQKEAIADGYDVAALIKALDSVAPAEETFYTQFTLPNTNVDNADIPEVYASMATNTVDQWSNTVHTTYHQLKGDEAQAVERYRSQNAEGLGGRESVAHYAAIFKWFGDEYRGSESALNACLGIVKGTITSIRRAATEVRDGLAPIAVARIPSGCDTSRTNALAIPDRLSRAEGLPIVKDWSGWLIRSESLPLTIIVGLVGFSFLGAGLSRIVRAGVISNATTKWLSASDLLLFVLSGAAASLSVFVASYGGLAVLGGTAADPNPYVVFVLCFAAAIYSEDVWIWLRLKVLSQVTEGNTQTTPNEGIGNDATAGTDTGSATTDTTTTDTTAEGMADAEGEPGGHATSPGKPRKKP